MKSKENGTWPLIKSLYQNLISIQFMNVFSIIYTHIDLFLGPSKKLSCSPLANPSVFPSDSSVALCWDQVGNDVQFRSSYLHWIRTRIECSWFLINRFVFHVLCVGMACLAFLLFYPQLYQDLSRPEPLTCAHLCLVDNNFATSGRVVDPLLLWIDILLFYPEMIIVRGFIFAFACVIKRKGLATRPKKSQNVID